MSQVEVDKIIPQSGTTLTVGESGDTITIPSGATLNNQGTATGFGISWQSDIKTSAFTAVAGEGYWINTTSAAITVTLPASASVGDEIEFTDYARTWGTNNLTLNPNSLNYQGNSSPNPVYNVNGQHVRIVYSGATQGWIPTVDDDVTLETPQSYTIDFLVIAGGGGGFGGAGGGGGGAGGYRNSFSTESSGGGGSSETELTLTPGTSYTITVGVGGTAGPNGAAGTNGGDSSISGSGITTITSIGGGAGGYSTGSAGGSGGGAVAGYVAGAGTANQGYGGGDGGAPGPCTKAGGGGGAGAVGGDSAACGAASGAGGAGLASSITGSSITRAGGGGGGSNSGAGGSGGSGGGGAGGLNTTGTAGSVNTGSGGGGGGTGSAGGAGGKGVVIIRMLTSNYSGTTTGSPTVSTDGSDTILVYNDSGTYTG